MKKILKFKYDEKEGFLSVVEKEDGLYALVEKSTPKVKTAHEDHKLWISYDLKNPNYQEVDVHVSEDMNIVEEVYKQLEAEKNLYFKELTDELCVLVISK